MNNETQRKITSLTLMTIMLAGGMAFAIPGMEPVHAANPNLTVSTNTFGGAMVLEVVINDPDYKDDNDPMPQVTFDNHDLIMAQAGTGSWYAYVADKNTAAAADDPAIGLEFGTPYEAVNGISIIGKGSFDDSAVVYANNNGTTTVVSSPPTLNPVTGSLGSINVVDGQWPFIQTFVFTDGDKMDVVYHAAARQTETITYDNDMDALASHSLDRTNYPHGADIHLTIDDMQLNIDPTNEDSWTFNTSNGTSYYGNNATGITPAIQNTLSYGDNGFLKVDVGNPVVITFESNDNKHDSLNSGIYVTVEENSPNSGVFENTDSGNDANMITSTTQIRGVSGNIDYNDKNKDVLIGYFLGNVVMDKSSISDSWGSGEPLTVQIIDEDENTNTKVDDDFDVSNSEFEAIPTIQIGNPTTLESKLTITSVTVTGTIAEDVLQADKKAITAELAIVAPWSNPSTINGNATQWFKIEEDHKAKLDPLKADLVIWQTNATASKLALDNALATLGISPATTAEKASKLNAALLKVSQLEILIDAVYNTEELKIKVLYETAVAQGNILAKRLADVNIALNNLGADGPIPATDYTVKPFSKILNINTEGISLSPKSEVKIVTSIDSTVLNKLADEPSVHKLINYDFSSMGVTEIVLEGATSGIISIGNDDGLRKMTTSDPTFAGLLTITLTTGPTFGTQSDSFNVLLDVFNFGQSSTGDRYNDAIYRLEAEETKVNSGVYEGTIEYIMLNQINIFKEGTFSSLETIGDELNIIVHEDLTDEDAIEVIYYDTDRQGIQTQVSAQEDAPTYSALVSFDQTNYKVADSVTMTIEDRDLNSDSDLIDIYTVVNTDDISLVGYPKSLMLSVTFNDAKWQSCTVTNDDGTTKSVDGLFGPMSTLRETSRDSGIFTASFQIPAQYCQPVSTDATGITTYKIESVTGNDLEISYIDFRDAAGEEMKVGDSAGVGASTGSISLDRTVYPVPFGTPDQSDSYFAVHSTAIGSVDPKTIGTYLANGDLTIHVRVNDPDFDVSASGVDKIAVDGANGPVKVMIKRGSSTMLLGTAGAEKSNLDGKVIGLTSTASADTTREFGPISEISRDSGVFELDMVIKYTDGPASTTCPTSIDTSVSHIAPTTGTAAALNHCILQGDILTVEYTDPTDASGDLNTVTDSATFDLRNGVLQSDKSVYIIGSDMILTLIEPDFDLDNDQAESYDLDLIEWDSDAATISMGNRGGIATNDGKAFDPEPGSFRETGDSTGIFQILIEIPESIANNNLERGEEIELEYTDWGPSGADYVGGEDEDVNVTIFTSNFGATIELDQKVYTWTDKVYITIVAPDHNFDGDLVDEIGNTSSDPIKVSTRGHKIDQYKLVETGTDTGIFTGEVILTGFTHDADGDTTTGTDGNDVVTSVPSADKSGPTDGLLPASDDDGLSVSFEFSDGETVLGSALIRWNIGEVQWLEASYPASGTGVVRIIDPDMNLNPESVDNFDLDVWSDSDVGGIDLTVTETNEATGIFEGTVFFTVTDQSAGHRLRVAEGDIVVAEYEDNTLPDPYTTADELDITATTLIGTIVPPLERAPAANLRAVDAFGNSLNTVTVDQQVQVSADLSNGQDRVQDFAYLVQIQDKTGVTVSLAWITGSLSEGQSFSPALSWIPTTSGSYTATAFVWESVDNPTALSPPISTTIDVS